MLTGRSSTGLSASPRPAPAALRRQDQRRGMQPTIPSCRWSSTCSIRRAGQPIFGLCGRGVRRDLRHARDSGRARWFGSAHRFSEQPALSARIRIVGSFLYWRHGTVGLIADIITADVPKSSGRWLTTSPRSVRRWYFDRQAEGKPYRLFMCSPRLGPRVGHDGWLENRQLPYMMYSRCSTHQSTAELPHPIWRHFKPH